VFAEFTMASLLSCLGKLIGGVEYGLFVILFKIMG